MAHATLLRPSMDGTEIVESAMAALLSRLCTVQFFPWEWIKSRADRLLQAFAELSMEMVHRTIDSYECRLRYCIQGEGKSVEQEYGN